ncbi:uncharacterized protein F4822DRAFT_445055 [Hypoxylon trugodes]|uniref:uncharacterized protein n=1 Tax=Hypoxylon trugodes TaxID=326681 RepID=UPI002197F21A|nr:uncharacterized protein F4822DRAFT_445055 [Hypoxylon trugodes]KAI1386886.1 hypothetical protein F4822DRAFT_445055 [Hypoxylon trugodes]
MIQSVSLLPTMDNATNNIDCTPSVSRKSLGSSSGPSMDTAADEVDFDSLKEVRTISTQGHHIIGLFKSALKLSPAAGLDEKAEYFVSEMLKYSPKEKCGLDPGEFVWDF